MLIQQSTSPTILSRYGMSPFYLAAKTSSRIALAFTILFISMTIQVSGQDISQLKDQISPERYNSFLKLLDEANRAENELLKADKFKIAAREVTRVSGDLSIKIYEEAISAAVRSRSDSMIAVINSMASIPRINTARYDQARELLNKAIIYFESSTDTLHLAKAYTHLAYLERLEGSNYKAIKNLYQAKALEEQLMPIHEMWDVVNRLMINYETLNDDETALTLGEEFLASARSHEVKPKGYTLILRFVGQLHIKLGNLDEAEKSIDEVTPDWIGSDFPHYVAYGYHLFYDLAMAKNEWSSANAFADSILWYCTKAKSSVILGDAHFRKYRVLKKLNKSADLAYHIHKALEEAQKSRNKYEILAIAKENALFEASLGNYTSAFHLQTYVDSLREKVYSEDMVNDLRRFEKQLVQAQSQQEIDLLNAQNELKELNLQKAERARKWLLGFLTLALISISLIYLLLRQRSENNKILEEKNAIISKALSEKELLLREIHHRVKNNLQFISSLLGLQSEHVEDDIALGALQEGQDRVHSMALIHQNLYQEDNLTGVDVHNYFRKLIRSLFDSYNIRPDRISLEMEIEDLNLDVDSVVPIGLIVNELISNSLKYAFPGNAKGFIEISLTKVNKELILTVKDNGIGISDNNKANMGESFGYKLVSMLNDQLDADLLIDGSDGTMVQLKIRNYKMAA